jgi:hypothetical protein
MPGKKLILSFAAVIALMGAVPALAADAEQQRYVDAVEPICKQSKPQEEKLKGAKALVKNGKLDAASKLFSNAAKALKQTRAKLLNVPKPEADAARLTKWLGHVKTEVTLFEAVARKLAKGEATAAQRMVVRLISSANQANNQVLDYEFDYCRFETSKFV